MQPRLGLGHRNDAASKPGFAQLFGQIEDVEKEQTIRGVPEEAAKNLAAAVVANENVQDRIVARAKSISVVSRQPLTDHRIRSRLAALRQSQHRVCGHIPSSGAAARSTTPSDVISSGSPR